MVAMDALSFAVEDEFCKIFSFLLNTNLPVIQNPMYDELALEKTQVSKQLEIKNLHRELNKAYCAFQPSLESPKVISTGSK